MTGLEFSCVPKEHPLKLSVSSTHLLQARRGTCQPLKLILSGPFPSQLSPHLRCIILKGGKSVSLDPLRPTPLPAGLPPAGAHCSRTSCTLLVQSQSSVDATMSIRDVAASCWCVHLVRCMHCEFSVYCVEESFANVVRMPLRGM